MVKKRLQIAAAIATLVVSGIWAAPAPAGAAEQDLLTSYVGSWSGVSALLGGEKPEPFTCRLEIKKGNQAKINYAGRCNLINMNLTVSGTIAFDDKARRYQAVMSSNAGFKGQAVGFQQGNRISFDLVEQQKDRGGNDVRIGSKIQLVGDSVRVDFEVEFNESGEVLTASVPFSR
jgi:hypothetical protein